MHRIFIFTLLLLSSPAFSQEGIDPAKLDSLSRSIAAATEKNRLHNENFIREQDSLQKQSVPIPDETGVNSMVKEYGAREAAAAARAKVIGATGIAALAVALLVWLRVRKKRKAS